MAETSDTTLTARKRYVCEAFDYRGRHFIEPGDEYVRTVCFPGDVNSSERPWVMRICEGCWTEPWRFPPAGRSMPARRHRRKPTPPPAEESAESRSA